MYSIKLNGQSVSTNNNNLIDFLEKQHIDITKKGIAIAINERVISRPEWENTILNNCDIVEVVRPFQGG